MKNIIRILLIVMMLIAAAPMAFAANGNIENNSIYEFGTNQPLNNTQGLLYKCTNSNCNKIKKTVFDQNSGASNLLTMQYLGTRRKAYYAKYFYTPGYLPWEGVFWDKGKGGIYNYDVFMYKANDCHAPVDSLAITNTVYANEPLVINIPALVDSTVTSAFRQTTAPPSYIPSGYNDYYSAETDIVLTIYDPNNVVAYTETQQVNLFADTAQDVTFTWTPVLAGNGYRAVVTTTVVDNQCANNTPQSAAKDFNVLAARPQNACYTLLNNLEYDNKFPIANKDTVTFTYERISNHADNTFTHTAIPTDVTYTIREGQSNPAGNVVYSQTTTLPATSSTTNFTIESFQWQPLLEGWYTLYVTGIGNSPLCSGLPNYNETVEVEVYVLPEPTVSVFFDVSDNADGSKIQGVTVTFNGQAQTTDVNGQTTFANVPASATYGYTATHPAYYPVTGSQYIGEADTYIYLSMDRIPAVNIPPTFTTAPIQFGCTPQAYIYDADATDADGDPLTYSLAIGPAGMTINTNTGLVTWSNPSLGTYNVQIDVTDGKATTSQPYTLQIDATCNQNPYFTSTPITTAVINFLYTYDADAVDPDGDPLVYSLTTSPAGMTIDPNTGLIQWTPTALGTYSVTARVDDNRGGFATQPYTITVQVDTGVTVQIVADPTEGPANLNVDFSAILTGNPPFTYAWDLDGDGAIDSTSATPSFTYTQTGTYTVTLTVTDFDGDIGSDTERIRVTAGAADLTSRKIMHFNTLRVLNEDGIHTGDQVELLISFLNNGPIDLKAVTFVALFPDAPGGGRVRVGPMNIDEGEQISRILLIDAPTTPGIHDLRITASNDLARRVRVRPIKILS